MRYEFLQIVEQLKTDPYYAISVVSDVTMKKILGITLGSTLVEKYGSIEAYFEHLKSSGISSFSVLEHRKNGSGWKAIKTIKNLTFQDKEITNAQPFSVQAVPQLNGSNGGTQMVGLGFYEAAGLMAASQDKVRLEEENKYLKTQNDELKKNVDELKEERLKQQYDASGKSSQNELLGGIIQNLPAILSGLKSINSSASLNAPVQSQGSEIKQQFIGFVNRTDVSDSLIEVLYSVANKIVTEESFSEKLEIILNTQN